MSDMTPFTSRRIHAVVVVTLATIGLIFTGCAAWAALFLPDAASNTDGTSYALTKAILSMFAYVFAITTVFVRLQRMWATVVYWLSFVLVLYIWTTETYFIARFLRTMPLAIASGSLAAIFLYSWLSFRPIRTRNSKGI
jgi:hypothetical protein